MRSQALLCTVGTADAMHALEQRAMISDPSSQNASRRYPEDRLFRYNGEKRRGPGFWCNENSEAKSPRTKHSVKSIGMDGRCPFPAR